MTGLLAKDITIDHGQGPILRGVDVVLRPGTLTGLVGENGAGKSSLLRVLAGIDRPKTGDVSWQNEPLPTLPKRDWPRMMVYVPQHRPVPPTATVQEVLTLGFGHMPQKLQAQRLERALTRLALDRFLDRAVVTLSGGERARVFLGRALVSAAPLVILDEPLAALDRKNKALVQEAFQAEARSGRTVLLTVHDTGDWPEADHILTITGQNIESKDSVKPVADVVG